MKTGKSGSAPALPNAKPVTGKVGGMKTTFGTRVMSGKK